MMILIMRRVQKKKDKQDASKIVIDKPVVTGTPLPVVIPVATGGCAPLVVPVSVASSTFVTYFREPVIVNLLLKE